MKQKIQTVLSDARLYWNIPMPGRYMTFKEIVSYAGGGIGAYFLITMGNNLLVNTNNMIVADAIGIQPTHVYILYILATLANIPLTAIRASMIDNTKSKAGKYRPYIISMGIPTAIICMAYVWFPYEALYDWFPAVAYTSEAGVPVAWGYVVKCLIVLVFNFLLQFFFNFFNDAYTNLIHVLSPNTQERTDVLSIKSVVYSLAPSIVNVVTPLIAGFFDGDMYDMRVYKYSYPVYTILGILLSIVVYANTKEKIIQAKTRVIQVKFIDAFKAVAKNKYFWIIALAGWLGFLEGAYGTILNWSFTYGKSCGEETLALINALIGNASLWGMLLASPCIRIFGKKKVLIGVNFMNIVCILAMGINKQSIIWLAVCIYFNWLFGAFEQILTPAIQADIRDYHHYKTGERIDGMFSTVQTIGNLVTLATSLVIPLVYEAYGIFEGNGYKEMFDILHIETGQPGLLYDVMGVLIYMAAFGAFLNMVPYFFYDLKESQQKSIVRILKIRAMFEDYGNGVSNDRTLVEAIEIINHAREMAEKQAVEIKKHTGGTKEERKAARKAKRAAREFNEDIIISRAVCDELVKFECGNYMAKFDACKVLYDKGLKGLYSLDYLEVLQQLADARNLPKSTATEREVRSFVIDLIKSELNTIKIINKYFPNPDDFKEPDFQLLDSYFDKEEECEANIKRYYEEQSNAKKDHNPVLVAEYTGLIKAAKSEKKNLDKLIEGEMNKHTAFNRVAKPYLTAAKVVKEKENYTHLEELEAEYLAAKARLEQAHLDQIAEQKALDELKAAAKAEKKNKK